MTHTKGEVKVGNFVLDSEATIKINGLRVCKVTAYSGDKFNDPPLHQAQANAELIRDAFNVTERTGLTPLSLEKHVSDLKIDLAASIDQVAELEERLKGVISVMDKLSDLPELELESRAILGAWVINSKKLLNK